MQQRKSAPKRSGTYHKGNVARDLLAAAAKMLKSERVEDISVRRLAREVGMTPANFYNHFASLDELLLTLAAEAFNNFSKDAARILARTKDRKEAILKRSVRFIEFAQQNQQIFRIMFGHIPDAMENEKFRLAADASFANLMNFIYQKDIYDVTDIQRTHAQGRAAYAVFALAYGLARNINDGQFQFATGSRAEVKKFVEDVMNTLLDGEVAKVLSAPQ